MKVVVYVEGGGDRSDSLAECRKAFHRFLAKLAPMGRRLKVVACGPRDIAFRDFRNAMQQRRGDAVLLLVDAEGPVSSGKWLHLSRRDPAWKKPRGAKEDDIHLMVQCMESWFLADRELLAEYYGKGFVPKALPSNSSVEQISKADIKKALERATTRTLSGNYYDHKTTHGFEILARIDPQKVCDKSLHANQLKNVLARLANSLHTK